MNGKIALMVMLLTTVAGAEVNTAKVVQKLQENDYQTIAHIEIAGYGTLLSYARAMQIDAVAALLEKSLSEEKMSDLKLTILGEYKINEDAKVETFISWYVALTDRQNEL